MADEGQERTEDPTARRKSKARQEGNVPQSQEVNNALFLLFMIFLLRVGGGYFLRQFLYLTRDGVSNLGHELTFIEIQQLIIDMSWRLFLILAPFALMMMAIGFLAAYIQFGLMFNMSLLKLKWDFLNFAKGFSKFFSLGALKNLGKSLLIVTTLLLISYFTIRAELLAFMSLIDRGIEDLLFLVGDVTLKLLTNILYIYILVAIGDFAWAKYEHNKKLKMTKSEVKDEHRQMEGDPQIKSKMRQVMMEESHKRMMKSVPEADVVITNPVHIAVALKYEMDKDEAPILLAKGKRLIAEKIKEIARENDIPIVEDKPLARLLYTTTKIGEEIGMDLYSAVAEILAYVYRMKNRNVV